MHRVPTVSGYLRKIIAHLEPPGRPPHRFSAIAAGDTRAIRDAFLGEDLADRRQTSQGVLRQRVASVLFASEETMAAATVFPVHDRGVSDNVVFAFISSSPFPCALAFPNRVPLLFRSFSGTASNDNSKFRPVRSVDSRSFHLCVFFRSSEPATLFGRTINRDVFLGFYAREVFP